MQSELTRHIYDATDDELKTAFADICSRLVDKGLHRDAVAALRSTNDFAFDEVQAMFEDA